MEVTQSFALLLAEFRCVFTVPSSNTFVTVIIGWVLSYRHRFVTELIQSTFSVGKGHHSRFHRFFSHAAWSLDELCRMLAGLLIAAFVPDGLILLAVDDTLCRKRGLTLFGAGMHHDPLISSRAMKLVSWGHNWVVVCLLVRNPFWASSKVFALPIAMRLYRNRQGLIKGQKKTKQSSRASSGKPTSNTAPARNSLWNW